jgi:hypothetical protein
MDAPCDDHAPSFMITAKHAGRMIIVTGFRAPERGGVVLCQKNYAFSKRLPEEPRHDLTVE